MFHWANLKGRQFEGNMGQALLPLSAVTREDSNLSLLPKQAGGLGPWYVLSMCLLFIFAQWIISIVTYSNPT